MRRSFEIIALCALCWISLAAPASANAGDTDKSRRVLFISDESSVMPGVSIIQRNAMTAITHTGLGSIEFDTEYFDAGRFPEPELHRAFLQYLREKYSSHRPDVIVAISTGNFDIATEVTKSIFPDVPVVLECLTEKEIPFADRSPRVTGHVQRMDILGTLELILKLQPKVRRIVVIGGIAAFDRMYMEKAERDARSLAGRADFEFWTDRSMGELQKGVSSLERDTAVLFTSMFRDAAGETFVPSEAAQKIIDSASVPVYGLFSGIVDFGAVGGSVIEFATMGKRAGELAGRILQGKASASTPIEVFKAGVPIFNWTALQQWGIKESRLPPNSIVQFRPPAVWEKYRWFTIEILVVITVQAVLIFGLILQRSRLRKAERSLRDSYGFMDLATTAGRLGLWVRDLTTDQLWTNSRLRSILGYGEEKSLAMEDIYGRIHPGDRDRVLSLLETFTREGKPFELDCRLLLPGGRETWVLVKGNGVLDPDGRLVRAQGVMLDKTESKLAEIEADRQRQEAAHMQRVSMMGELAASLAHELNQPLTAILSNAQAAQRFLAADPPNLKEVREILGDVVTDDKRASEVIRRLRELARNESPNFVPLDLAEVIRDVVKLTHGDAVENNISFTVEHGDGLPRVWGDRVQLPQVVLNLLLNALDAMKESADHEGRIIIRVVQEDDGMIRVSVSDRGKGLNENALDKIFDPFYTTKREGMGMGLAISRSIIKAHGGRLWAENNTDRGATFNFTVRVDRRRTGRFASRPESDRKRSDGFEP